MTHCCWTSHQDGVNTWTLALQSGGKMLFFLSIFIGEYLWIHLVQQRRLILRQTGIFTFGVSNPFFSPPRPHLVFHHSFYYTYLSSKSFVWRTALSSLSTWVHCQTLTCYSTVTRASVCESMVFLCRIGKAQPLALGFCVTQCCCLWHLGAAGSEVTIEW